MNITKTGKLLEVKTLPKKDNKGTYTIAKVLVDDVFEVAEIFLKEEPKNSFVGDIVELSINVPLSGRDKAVSCFLKQ